jgi:hydroxyisourate hydrolase
MRIDLYRAGEHLKTVMTNADGRTDEPLLAGGPLAPGVYELVFHAAGYFKDRGETLSDPPFLGEVVIRFGVSDPEGAYHVPLLLAPYGYSAYRGS